MNRAVLCCVVVSSVLLSFLSLSTANAIVIDASGGPVDSQSFAGYNGSDTAGGTFTHFGPTGELLYSFSLSLGSVGGTPVNSLTAVVYGTDAGGAPDASNLLWASSAFDAAAPTPQVYTFNPLNVTLAENSTYFIGVVSGPIGLIPGFEFLQGTIGDFTIEAAIPGFIGDDRIAGGMFWSSMNGGAFSSIENWDVRTTVVTANPEPSTALLMGVGLGLLAHRRRAQKSSLPH